MSSFLNNKNPIYFSNLQNFYQHPLNSNHGITTSGCKLWSQSQLVKYMNFATICTYILKNIRKNLECRGSKVVRVQIPTLYSWYSSQ